MLRPTWLLILNLLVTFKFGVMANGAAAQTCGGRADVTPDHELLVHDRAVITNQRANPGGPWHFSTLVKELLPLGATDAQASAVIVAWLTGFAAERQVPVDPTKEPSADNPLRTLSKRPDVKRLLLDPWLSASRQARLENGLDDDGTLDLRLAPFKLLTIVNRTDTRDKSRCRTSAGEGRFVFAALNQPTDSPTTVSSADTLPMTLIFEYQLPTAERSALAWALVWRELSTIDCRNCETYLARLEEITVAFSKRLASGESSLGQLRTNETLSFPGELREFVLVSSHEGRSLEPKAVMRTPDWSLNGDPELAMWLVDNAAAILEERHELPGKFLGISSPTLQRRTWEFAFPAETDPEQATALRFSFSKNTCNGCHSLEPREIPNLEGVYQINPQGELSSYILDTAFPERQDAYCELLNNTVCEDDLGPILNLKARTIH